MKFLKQKDIHTKAPENFLKLKISESLIEEFKESGLIIYKKGMFADAGAKKFMLNLGKSLSQNPLYKAHFKRNFNLIDLRRTPKDIQENILNELESAEVNIDSKFILDFFQKHNLRDQLAHADDFIGGSFEVKKVQFDLEDW